MTGSEADPHQDWPDRTPIYDEDDRLLLVFTPTVAIQDGRKWADGVWRPQSIPKSTASAAALDAFAGWAVSSSDEPLTQALLDAGAELLRHAHVMTHDLRSPSGRPGEQRTVPGLHVEPLTSTQVDRHAALLGELQRAAYPAGHPDHRQADTPSAVATMRAVARGQVLGPLQPESRIAVYDATIAAACLVVDRGGAPPDGGPWILDLFRDPACPVSGVGRLVLHDVLTAAASRRLSGLSLAVSHANTRARHLYDALGFVETSQSWTLRLP